MSWPPNYWFPEQCYPCPPQPQCVPCPPEIQYAPCPPDPCVPYVPYMPFIPFFYQPTPQRCSPPSSSSFSLDFSFDTSTSSPAPRARPQAVAPAQARLLTVEKVHFHAMHSAKEHHTEMYELLSHPLTSSLSVVLRRGEEFHFTIEFNRDFRHNDYVSLIFQTGGGTEKDSRIVLELLNKSNAFPSNWDTNVHYSENKVLCMDVKLPALALVGLWKCSVETNIKAKRNNNNKIHECDENIFILFNPWCPEDAVWMENEKWKEEYILNQTGKVWVGSHSQPEGRRWNFGQFDVMVLPMAIVLLNQSDIELGQRSCPVHVVRAISAVVNSFDNKGILAGRWDGNYEDGTSPLAWTGSLDILKQYAKGEPVKYGQCWVFSALVVTICRVLGIPCRSVTNYVSAHDSNETITIEKYFDKEGNDIRGGPNGDCRDSVWNFHCWNDVWMKRRDIESGFDGWQAVDATPQERSDHIYRCGPAPVKAIRNGNVNILYDTPFVFSEVNADIFHFMEDDTSNWGFSRLALDQYHIGRKIVTKSVGMDDYQGDSDLSDITFEYKNPEGTPEERSSVLNAIRGNPAAERHYSTPMTGTHQDVQFRLYDIQTVPYGDSFEVAVHVRNASRAVRTLSATLSASSIYYTGKHAFPLKNIHQDVTLRPGQNELLKIYVESIEYMDKIVDHGAIKIYATAHVSETGQTWSEEADLILQKPMLVIGVENVAQVGNDYTITFTLQNPLDDTLVHCYIIVEIPGMLYPQTLNVRDVSPKEVATFSHVFKPTKAGHWKILATFTSSQLGGIVGNAKIII